VGGGERQPLPGAAQRDLARAPPHRLDRPKPRGRQQVAGDRGDQHRDRAAHGEGGDEARQRLVAVVEGLAHRHDLRPRRPGEDAGRSLDSRHPPVDHDDAARGGRKLGAAKRRAARPARRVEHPPAPGQHLGEALLALFGRPGGGGVGGGDGPGACFEPGAKVVVQIVLEAQIDEQAGRREDQHHRQGEGGGQAQADRQAAHRPPSLRSR
jgi:hypothetical protein